MRVWKFGDNIDTDAIIPGRYLTIYDPRELASHAFEGTRDEFSKDAREGDIVVGGSNFGCGSSREHAPLALSGAGIHFIIAQSFARIFYRNAINVGLLPLICPDAGEIPDGSKISVRIREGYIEYGERKLTFEPVPEFLQNIIDAGGLVEFGRDRKEVPLCTKSQ
ncbi:MAG TPA: 3-isopropylmalate dehydratase small subunit [Methanoregulaceae archaeon]|mgnify:CR=1 FL=1|nr:3-isopropylmalate dehydratase small subunit [Methanolinea sp.]MCC7566914.1 3-isopropylmalate dehydratase small subunit [Methanoregulaceae archaeon]MDD3090494.1 3-isopropylmalate dehydratase small subunit [Methanoregulaceae archaeon]MDD5047438.1 3-isopropylmalate dehydratase small subunit [Methanoregulaceae archaeon]MDD5684140.1 3-isopropylmalate dehydratase small subunit [Methanoregulaceae archaeon]